jgi:MFS superfamily sulfate permease-like transporter
MLKDFIRNNAIVLQLSEKVILGNDSLFEEMIALIKKNNKKTVIFDLGMLDVIDDRGLDALYTIISRYYTKGYSFQVANPSRALVKQLVFKNIIDRVKIIQASYET